MPFFKCIYRSVQKYQIQFSHCIGDGDASVYSTIEPLWCYMQVTKECVSNVTKGMGSNLRSLFHVCKGKKLDNGKGFSGKGCLSRARMDVIQNL